MPTSSNSPGNYTVGAIPQQQTSTQPYIPSTPAQDRLLQNPSDVTDAQIAESQAQQLYTSSMSTLGQPPNPQLVSDTIASGATQDVAQSFSDPTIASYAAAHPIGNGTMQAGPTQQQGQNLDTFDANHWNAMSKMAMQHSDYLKNTWGDLGEIPAANFQYISELQNGSSDRIKKWQQMMMDRGIMAQTHGATGSWDADTNQALQSFYIAYMLPTALYGKNDQEKVNASIFLNRLAGINVSDIQKQLQSDPSFATQVVANWSMTQGPKNQLDSLHAFADQFGSDKLPSALQNLENPGLFQNALQTIWTPFGGIGSLVSHLTGLAIGKPDEANPVEQWFQNNSPAAAHEREVEAQLSESDKQLMNPALQQAKASTGFLPLQAWDQKKNDFILSLSYYAQDAFMNGDQDKNPFDTVLNPDSRLAKMVQANHDDLMVGLMGQQWVKDHATLSGFLGFYEDTFDDPITVASMGTGLEAGAAETGAAATAKTIVGRTARLPSLAAGVTLKGAKDLLNKNIRQAPFLTHELSSPALTDLVEKWKGPRAALERAVADGVVAARDNGSIYNVLHLLQVGTKHELNHGRLRPVIDQILDPSTDAATVRSLIADNFKHTRAGVQGLYNMKRAMQTLTSESVRRMGHGGITRMRAIGALHDGGIAASTGDEGVIENMDKMHGEMAMADVSDADINKVLNEYFKLKPEERGLWIDNTYPKIMDEFLKKRGTSVAEVQETAAMLHGGRSFSGFRDSILASFMGRHGKVRKNSYAPTPTGSIEHATEQSRMATGSDIIDRQVQHIDSAISTLKQEIDKAVQNGKSRAWKGNPGLTDEQALEVAMAQGDLRSIIEGHKDSLDRLEQAREDTLTRSGPMFSYQLQQTAYWPFTQFELAAHLHKGLYSAEKAAAIVRADAFYGVWKPLALARPSTALRIVGGDDLIRLTDMALKGHGITAARAMFGGLKNAVWAGSHLPGSKRMLEAMRAEMQDVAQSMDLSKYLGEMDPSFFLPYGPQEAGYANAFKQMFNGLKNSPEISAWARAEAEKPGSGKDALVSAYKEKTQGAEELIKNSGLSIEDYASKVDEYMSQWARNPSVLKMLADGKVDDEILNNLVKSNPEMLPNVTAARKTAFAYNAMASAITKGPNMLFEHVTRASVDAARGKIAMELRSLHERNIRKLYPEWTDEEVGQLANGQVQKWMANNLYQGQRSIAGRALRHVFPFGGATSNMTRFWLREVKQHPWIALPMTRELTKLEGKANQGNDKSTWIGGNILQALGFSGTDSLQANLSHSLFLSSDGIASFVPGFGPIFSPVLSFADKNQSIHDVLTQIPGIREQVQLNQGGGSVLPSWIGQGINAASMATTGNQLDIPGFGIDSNTMQRRIDQRYEQLYAEWQSKGMKGPEPTQEDATKSLGRTEFTGDVLGALAPVQPTIDDQRRLDLAQAEKDFRNATTPAEQDQVIANYPDAAPMLKYFDPRTSPEDKDKIANDPKTAWVVPYSQSLTETDATKPATQSDYDNALALGNLHILGVNELQSKIGKSQNWNQGWQDYNELIAGPEQLFLQQTGVSKQSTEYSNFNKEYIQPRLQYLANQNPDWYAQFASGGNSHNTLGLEQKTQPLRSLMTWEVIPQHSNLENQKSILWRKALVYKDSAAAEINWLHSTGGSSQQVKEVMDELKARLGDLEAANPEFAAELNQYSFNRWEDVVNYESDAATSLRNAGYNYNPLQGFNQ